FFFQAEDGIRDRNVTGVQTCALPIYLLDQVRAGLCDPVALLGGHDGVGPAGGHTGRYVQLRDDVAHGVGVAQNGAGHDRIVLPGHVGQGGERGSQEEPRRGPLGREVDGDTGTKAFAPVQDPVLGVSAFGQEVRGGTSVGGQPRLGGASRVTAVAAVVEQQDREPLFGEGTGQGDTGLTVARVAVGHQDGGITRGFGRGYVPTTELQSVLGVQVHVLGTVDHLAGGGWFPSGGQV